METLRLLTYTAVCAVIFKVFKAPLNKWTVPTAALGGVIMIGTLVLMMNYNHPYSNMAREFFVTTPIVPGVSGIVTSVSANSATSFTPTKSGVTYRKPKTSELPSMPTVKKTIGPVTDFFSAMRENNPKVKIRSAKNMSSW